MLTTPVPTTVISLDDLPSSSSKKLITTTEKAKSKLSTATSATSKYTVGGKRSQKPIHESDVDMENLPVIHGSFEITKTDADIAQKRSGANQRPASTASLTPSTLKPFFISPASSIKIKPNEMHSTVAPTVSENILEMFLQHQKQQIQKKIKEPVTAKIEKTNKNGETMLGKTHASSTTTATPTTENSKSADSPIISISSTSSTTVREISPLPLDFQLSKNLPQLDVSLFTSAPILDNEPWRPINPSSSQVNAATANLYPKVTTSSNVDSSSVSPDILHSPFNPNPPETVLYRNKFVDPDMIHPLNTTSDSDSVLYQSFYNPEFSVGELAIEKLGIADVKPYPLPVNKIDLNEIQRVPDFKPLSPGETNKTESTKINYDMDKFEHLGGGVIAKKPETNEELLVDGENVNDSLDVIHENEEKKTRNTTETSLADIFQELLDLDDTNDTLNFNKTDDNKLESRIALEDSVENLSTEQILTTTERLNFMNMKDFIVQMQKNKSNEEVNEENLELSSFEMISGSSMQTTAKPTTAFIQVETMKNSPSTAVTVPQTTAPSPQLFPAISKWEFVNGTQANVTEASITKKVFNETLQAVIVENSQTTASHESRVDNSKDNRTVDKTNLQQLSSIFDTLAAKLGIKPIDLASKMPPFSQHNKFRNNNRTTRKPSTTAIRKQRPTTRISTTKATPTPSVYREMTKMTSSSEFSLEPMMGHAEVEPVDPTKYEEILSLMSSSPITRFTSTTPSLVTLLPVKSNSGIRNFNPRVKLSSRPQEIDEIRNLETVVKASVNFNA
ncbi:CLUMA_CG016118, isoform A [Clunio marinus]|uniref:CLUMA_CG016118, isoform A n=1 Tax=Clunio marinus TaxID=568069 RepID=A0A1J1IQY7_9DIPT|nr:CLUMA_CG016118, isoform A [Clunio marinus]